MRPKQASSASTPVQFSGRYTTSNLKEEHLKSSLENACISTDPSNISVVQTRFQSWSRGSAITQPKIETSNNIIQVGNGCFLFLLSSFGASTLFASSTEESPCFSNLALDLSSCGACDETCCSECSSWSCLSTYSGNNFLNAALSRRSTSDPIRI